MIDTIALNAIGQGSETLYEYVESIDGVNYVSGSFGQVKKVIDKDSDGNIMKYTQFYYENANRPTKPTRSREFGADE